MIEEIGRSKEERKRWGRGGMRESERSLAFATTLDTFWRKKAGNGKTERSMTHSRMKKRDGEARAKTIRIEEKISLIIQFTSRGKRTSWQFPM